MKRFTAQIIAVLTIAVAAPVQAVGTIAVSDDGSTLMTAGGYCLYRHDPATLQVIKRTRFDQGIKDIALNQDGSIYLCSYGSFGQTISIRKTATDEEIAKVEKMERISGFGNVDKVFIRAMSADIMAFRSKKGAFHFYKASDASKITEFEHQPSQKDDILLACISPDGKTLAVISDEIKLPKEKETEKGERKKDASAELKQKELTDGKGSIIYRYEIATGKLLSTSTLHICPDSHMSPQCEWGPDGITIFSYSDANASISKSDKVTRIFKAGGLGYGMGMNPKGTHIAKGSMIGSGVVLTLSDLSTKPIQGATPNPGFPEYYKRIVYDKQGHMYGLTGADRIFRVNESLTMHLVTPVM